MYSYIFLRHLSTKHLTKIDLTIGQKNLKVQSKLLDDFSKKKKLLYTV